MKCLHSERTATGRQRDGKLHEGRVTESELDACDRGGDRLCHHQGRISRRDQVCGAGSGPHVRCEPRRTPRSSQMLTSKGLIVSRLRHGTQVPGEAHWNRIDPDMVRVGDVEDHRRIADAILAGDSHEAETQMSNLIQGASDLVHDAEAHDCLRTSRKRQNVTPSDRTTQSGIERHGAPIAGCASTVLAYRQPLRRIMRARPTAL